MKELLEKFENRRPEIVFEWKDSETEAEGWIVINSLRGGAAGGGTRMRLGLDKREVESLAKTMEVKFTITGPAIGGAKSGINFDPKDPRKEGVLRRWFEVITPLLKSYYGTGGDLNVDEIHEVIPYTEDCGVLHPQEGVFTGHYKPNEEQKKNRIEQLKYGVLKVIESAIYSPDLSKKYVIADMITGYGVAESVIHYYKIWNKNSSNKKVLIQGWGNVASSTAYYLSLSGYKIVGIIDRIGGLIKEEGFSHQEITDIFNSKNGNEICYENLLSFEECNERFWNVKADIFMPCAASRIVTKEQIEKMINNGLELISCGANVPFADKEIFFGPIAEYTDNNISLIPDFISNCGMARVFAYLMSQDLDKIDDDSIFNDVSLTIEKAIKKVFEKSNEYTKISKNAFEIALMEVNK